MILIAEGNDCVLIFWELTLHGSVEFRPCKLKGWLSCCQNQCITALRKLPIQVLPASTSKNHFVTSFSPKKNSRGEAMFGKLAWILFIYWVMVGWCLCKAGTSVCSVHAHWTSEAELIAPLWTMSALICAASTTPSSLSLLCLASSTCAIPLCNVLRHLKPYKYTGCCLLLSKHDWSRLCAESAVHSVKGGL